MKKNRMMRLASALLVAVLLTTSMISGTFAKYVTENSGSDSAQVAKFGVAVDVADDLGLFNTEYAKSDSKYTSDLSVKSSTSAQMVAPGTYGSMTFTVTGKPEVATRVSIEFDSSSKAIQLAAGEYVLPAGYFKDTETKVTTTEVYEPIKFYFGPVKELNAADYTMTLDALKTEMTTAFTQDYEPNHEYNAANADTYLLAWSWAFEDTSIENVNFLDTYLGYQAVTAAQQEILNFKITVTQID